MADVPRSIAIYSPFTGSDDTYLNRAGGSQPIASDLDLGTEELTAGNIIPNIVNAAAYGAVTTGAKDAATRLANTNAIIAAAAVAASDGAPVKHGIVIIPPGCAYNYDTLTAPPPNDVIPERVTMWDLSMVSGSYDDDHTLGMWERGDPAATVDNAWVIASGHHPVLALENSGKSGSSSATTRNASITWRAGRIQKGPNEHYPRSLAMLQFSKAAVANRWQLALIRQASWAAANGNYWRWGAGVTVDAADEYCFQSPNYYRAMNAGVTGAAAPVHSTYAYVGGATNATPIEITTRTDHGFVNGERVFIEGVLGNTAANGLWTITWVSATQFTLDGSVGNGAYATSYGAATQVVSDGAIEWAYNITGYGSTVLSVNDYGMLGLNSGVSPGNHFIRLRQADQDPYPYILYLEPIGPSKDVIFRARPTDSAGTAVQTNLYATTTGWDFTGGDVKVLGNRLQSFVLKLKADSGPGVLQHAVRAYSGMSDDTTANSTAMTSQITGASATVGNTPEVAAGVDFVNGVGVDAAAKNVVFFNTAAQNEAKSMLMASIDFNDTGTALNVAVRLRSIDVNGVTQLRPSLEFTNAATGAAFDITYANLGADNTIAVKVHGFIA